MTILGISASGREDGITAEAVKAVLEATGEPYQYVSLASLQVGGCRGCTRCATDNRCRVEDDWLPIGDQMLEAEALVFGAPTYYGMINALGHACLERTFCFRHREVFSLAGKLGVAIGVGGSGDSSPVIEHVRRMMTSNLMAVAGTLQVDGFSQCYTCGYGQDCAVGGVVGRHGFLDSIETEHLPPRLAQQETAVIGAHKLGKKLGSILQARQRMTSQDT
jgi:multimeric flavodoxin WrbA